MNSIDLIKKILFENKIIFDSKNQTFEQYPTFENIKNIKVGTLFSGIGSFEHALEILKIPHSIEFSCDNGNILLESFIKPNEKIILDGIKDNLDKLNYVESLYKKNKRKKNHVKESYLANYNLDEKNFFHDVRFVGKHINKEIDILVGGSPCQAFSIIGKRGGFEDTRGTLFFEFARCVQEFQPKVFIYENVKGLTNHDKGQTFQVVLNTFEDLGYKFYHQVLNAKDYGIPQSRPRIFIIGFKDTQVNFEFPKPIELKNDMCHFLQESFDEKYFLSINQSNFVRRPEKLAKKYTQIDGNIGLCQRTSQQYNLQGDFVDEKYYLSDKLTQYVLNEGTKKFKLKPSINTKIAKTLLSSMHKMHRASIDNYVTGRNHKLRKLTPRECLRLMGFCDTFKQEVSDLQMYKQCGNSIVVDVFIHIIIQLIKTEIFN